ncbi:MAG: DoxX family protein [Saprospiraceae bacterium]
MSAITNILSPGSRKWALDLGLFILRAGAGLLLVPHGFQKLTSFGEKSSEFYNFLHLGGPVSMALTIFSELVCSILLILGLGTRLIIFPLILTMVIIVFVINGDSSLGDKESGLLYLIPFVVILFTGPGRISLDQLFFRKKQAAKSGL